MRAAKSSDSDSEEKFKENLRLKAQQRKQRMAEAKVDDQERKLVEFAQRLSARKNKVSYMSEIAQHTLECNIGRANATLFVKDLFRTQLNYCILMTRN